MVLGGLVDVVVGRVRNSVHYIILGQLIVSLVAFVVRMFQLVRDDGRLNAES